MTPTWFATQSEDTAIDAISPRIYQAVCRTGHEAPGFFLVRQSNIHNSLDQRQSILTLKESLSALSQQDSKGRLEWFTLNRFNQKNSTKPHRDGAPEHSLLILGYEPSPVPAALSMADYSKLALQMHLTPDQILENHNPMYIDGAKMLEPFTTTLDLFDHNFFNLVIVNNSSAKFDPDAGNWQGVLHCAQVGNGMSQQEMGKLPRVINSTVVFRRDASGTQDSAKEITSERIDWFARGNELNESAYA